MTAASYPGQALPAPRPALDRDALIERYQRHPIPGQLALFPPTFYVPRADGGRWLGEQWANRFERRTWDPRV